MLAYHVPQTNRLPYRHQHQPFHHSRHRMQQDSESSSADISYNIESGIYKDDQHRFVDLDFGQLAESAKDPNNLKNGIYHDGAVTYDLGLPNYEILNPYEPPEIITPDHPHYQEQLNYIQLTNNFTIEDFGVTTLLESDKLFELSHHNATTITDKPEPSTTTSEDLKTSVALALSSPPPFSPSPRPPLKKLKTMKVNIEEHLKITNGKIEKLNNKTKIKTGNHKINATTRNVKQTPKPTVHSTSTDQSISSGSNEDTNQPQLHTHYPIPISIETFDKDDDILNNFYGQSVLLAPPSISPEIESQHYTNAILSLPYINSDDTSYLNPMLSDQKRSLRLTTVDSFDTTYYTSTEKSSEESSPSSDSIP